MKSGKEWLSSHKFETHLTAFLLIILPAIPLFYVAQLESNAWIWGLLSLVILGNLLELAIR